MKEIVFATNNRNKLAEIQQMLAGRIRILSLTDINCRKELPESKDTLEGNALEKAMYVSEHYHVNCFADDTGLEVNSLEGKPGVYSARYAGPGKNARDNMNKLLDEMRSFTDRSARFRTVIAFVIGKDKYLFEGEVKGKIIAEMRGNHGFGYDPVFVPEGYEQTFAEMSAAEKNKISHRAEAVKKLVKFLRKNYEIDSK
jgi:XTP/dITP diphosphohydrolase